MIDFFIEFYNFILSGAAISLLVAVLFIWYCVYKDMKAGRIDLGSYI